MVFEKGSLRSPHNKICQAYNQLPGVPLFFVFFLSLSPCLELDPHPRATPTAGRERMPPPLTRVGLSRILDASVYFLCTSV